MKALIQKIAIKTIITILILVLISVILTAIMPTFSNDMALGQLENDDVSFMLMETWNKIQNGVAILQSLISAVCIGSIGVDVYKFSKNNKENN